jgi:Leucine-rich repeat (LRR) protein
MTNLETLSLNHNQIVYLHQDTFANLRKLRLLHLDNNQIGDLHSEIFRDLKSLEQLNLSNNKLRKVDRSIFVGLRNLKKILIHNNHKKLSKKETIELFVEQDVIDSGFIITFKQYEKYLDQNDKNSVVSTLK